MNFLIAIGMCAVGFCSGPTVGDMSGGVPKEFDPQGLESKVNSAPILITSAASIFQYSGLNSSKQAGPS